MTGGAGYIGSIVVEELIKSGESVVVFDNLFQGHRTAVHPDAIFVEGDLADRVAVDAALAEHRPEAIMHFASHTLVGESMESPFRYLGENVTNGLNLLQSAVEHGVRRFILSSTANLFDDPERMPIDEQERIVPGSPYGESKYVLERMLYWLDRSRRDLVRQSPKSDGKTIGTFALRSPVRPNPIGLSRVRLIGRKGRVLEVRGLDCLDGTPLVDLKPDRFAFTVQAPPKGA